MVWVKDHEQDRIVKAEVVLTGSISVDSDPSGASILLDGVDTGKITPYVLTDVPVGTHTITVKLEGYKTVSKTVEVYASETSTVWFELEKEVIPSWIAVPILGGAALMLGYMLTREE